MIEEAAFALVLLTFGVGTARWEARQNASGGQDAPSETMRLCAWLILALWLVALGGAIADGTWNLAIPAFLRASGAAILAAAVVLLLRRRPVQVGGPVVALLAGATIAVAAGSAYVLVLAAIPAACLMVFQRLSV